MSIADRSNLDRASALYKNLFQELFVGKSNEAYKNYTLVDSVTQGTSYEFAFLSAMPKIRKWTGNKQFAQTRANRFNIPIENVEVSTMVSKVDWKLNPNFVGKAIRSFLTGTASNHINQLIVAKLLRGATDTCYDGLPLFSTSHPDGPGGGAQSNTSTNALTLANYRTAREGMRGLKDERGTNLGIRPDVLLVGPALESRAKEILEARDRIVAVDSSGAESGTRVAAASVENVSATDGVRIVVDPDIDGVDATGTSTKYYWFLIDSRYQPMVWAEGEALGPTDNTNEYLSTTPDYKFSVEGMAAWGFGVWQGIFAGRASSL